MKISVQDIPVLQDDITVAERVLQLEADALLRLKNTLDQSFSRAVQVISEAKGRVIVSGMGKSGHIARKIAASMASTGTPAFFIHPGEASHGDLGMIKEGEDVVLALSNSGNAPELNDMIEHTRRFSIPLIGMTGDENSTLGRRSDLVLLLPKVAEACPNNQAPTTSTTMMIALGDALSIALLERRGLTAEQFRKFHPGGKLGQKLKTVADIMAGKNSVPHVSIKDNVQIVLAQISKGGKGCVCVVDGGKLIGIITDGDIRRHAEKAGLDNKTACELMTADPKFIKKDNLAAEAIAVMSQRKITLLPVLASDKTLEGILHIHDCLDAAII